MFAPCCTVPDDLRWGRTYEAFEDPAVVAELAAAEVRGIQTCGVPMAACVALGGRRRDGARHRHEGL